jgi:uncharacterized tellurite resistance protein B-like protein
MPTHARAHAHRPLANGLSGAMNADLGAAGKRGRALSLIARLRDLVDQGADPDPALPDRQAALTVAALLSLVARADGRLEDAEEDDLQTVLRSWFGLSHRAAARLLDRAGRIDDGPDPVPMLAERIVHVIAPEERPRLLALAYHIAASDGEVHDFEDDLVWRVGRLLGLSDEAVAAVRDSTLGHGAPREHPGA